MKLVNKFKDKALNLKSVSLWTAVGLLVLSFLVAYTWKINSQFTGFSVAEASSVEATKRLGINYLVNAPYDSLQLASIAIFGETPIGVRLTSVLFGLASVVIFYILMRQLTNKNMSIFSTIMFAGSSWMLHLSRHGDSTITNIFWPIAIFLVAYNVYKFHLAWFWYIFAGIILGLSVYTPRMIYFVIFALIIGTIVFHRYETKMNKGGALGGLIAFIVLLTPLIYSSYINQSQISQIFAFDVANLNLVSIFQNFVSSISTIAWSSDLPNYLNLGNLPVFNIVELSLAVLGLFVIFTDIRAPRSWLLLALLLGSFTVMSLAPIEVTNIYIVLPVVSILIGIGLFTLWTRWRDVFPKNQAARSLAIGSLAFLVTLSTAYHFERYFLAWSNVPETKLDYSFKIPANDTINNTTEKE